MLKLITVAIAVLFCGSASAGDYFSKYKAIQKDLIAQRVTQATIDAAEILFPEEPKFIESLKTLAGYSESSARTNYLMTTAANLKVYFEFTKLPANADVLYDFVDEQQTNLEASIKSSPASAGQFVAWGISYALRANLNAFKATRETRFLDLFIRGARVAFANTDNALNLKDDFGHDDLMGWGLVSADKRGREMTAAGMVVTPILELDLLIKNDPTIDSQRKAEIARMAATSVMTVKSYLGQQIIDGPRRYFRNEWSGEQDAINHLAAFAQAAAVAYKLTGDTAFKDSAEGFLAYFLSNVRKVTTQPGDKIAYAWPYQVVPTGQHDEQFWKGAITISSLVTMHEYGITVPQEARVGILISFFRLVLRPHYALNGYVSDFNFPITSYNSLALGYSNGLLFSYYMLLDKWDASVRNTVLETVASRPDVFTMGLLMHISDAVAYSHMLTTPQE